MDTSRFPRGTVLLCRFPFDEYPTEPGPEPHFCLVLEEVMLAGKPHVFVCYGTSSFDDALFKRYAHNVLSVDSRFIEGIDMPKDRGNFIPDRIAIIPVDDAWIVPGIQGRVTCIRPPRIGNDAQHARLYAQYRAFQPVFASAIKRSIDSVLTTGQVGLPVRSN